MNRLRPMRSDGPRHAHALPWRFAGPLFLLVAALVAPRTSAAQMLPSDDPPPTRPPSRVVARESAEVVAGAHADEAGFLSTVPMQINGARGQTAGTGRRIDIDLRDADIHNVLRLLADVGQRQHRHLRRRDRQRHHSHAQRPVGPGARGDPRRPRASAWSAQGNIIRIAPLVDARQGARARDRAAQSRTSQLAPLETRLIPVSYAHGERARSRAPRICSRRAARSPSTSAPTCSSCATWRAT